MGCGLKSWVRGSLLGVGAFGQVNLAMDRETGEFFAVKSTTLGISSSSNNNMMQDVKNGENLDVVGAQSCCLAAMENEIHMLQNLESEFVVRCLGSDWSEEGGQRMRNVFLEYMPGGSLSDVLKQFGGAGACAGVQCLSEALIRSYTRSILQGIDYLHRRGIVHCDIKGKNVLVGNAGAVKLADFGSAKCVSGSETGGSAADGLRKPAVQDLELEDCVVRKVNGTPLWMAPEVVLQKEQGLASDIWSLGCTVVEMATGQAPWAQIANPFVALYHIGCTDEVPAMPASLSPAAHDFLARCFQRDPRIRWTSAQLLEHPFLTGEGGAAAAAAASPCSEEQVATPPSPPTTSVVELDNGSSSAVFATLESSVPPLSSPRFWKLAAFQSSRANRACQDVEQAAGTETSDSTSSRSCCNDWHWGAWPLSPRTEGEWIVVRSPKGNSIPDKKFDSGSSSSSIEAAAPAVVATAPEAHCTTSSTTTTTPSSPPFPPSVATLPHHSTEADIELSLETCRSSTKCSGIFLQNHDSAVEEEESGGNGHRSGSQIFYCTSLTRFATPSVSLENLAHSISSKQKKNHILQQSLLAPVGGTQEFYLEHRSRRRRRRRRRVGEIQIDNSKVYSPLFLEEYVKLLTSFRSPDLFDLGCDRLSNFMTNKLKRLRIIQAPLLFSLLCVCVCAQIRGTTLLPFFTFKIIIIVFCVLCVCKFLDTTFVAFQLQNHRHFLVCLCVQIS